MKHIQKWSALLMAVTLLFTLAAPAALATESTVTIKTAEDLAELSRNCTLVEKLIDQDTAAQQKVLGRIGELDKQKEAIAAQLAVAENRKTTEEKQEKAKENLALETQRLKRLETEKNEAAAHQPEVQKAVEAIAKLEAQLPEYAEMQKKQTERTGLQKALEEFAQKIKTEAETEEKLARNIAEFKDEQASLQNAGAAQAAQKAEKDRLAEQQKDLEALKKNGTAKNRRTRNP